MRIDELAINIPIVTLNLLRLLMREIRAAVVG
jgi:hypothetical protein